ncbi:hypothetical protein PIB30_090586, partial [Stylosanthes scabra]|nr:hypothetical protein [Stylosanthes scabra]
MTEIYKRLDNQQEESRKSFEAINQWMDRMDDQLSFLYYSNQMVNETMYFPYQNTARQFREMDAQGIPVTIANLAIHRHREEEMNQERMRYDQILQEAAAHVSVTKESIRGVSNRLIGPKLFKILKFHSHRVNSNRLEVRAEPIRFWTVAKTNFLNRFATLASRLELLNLEKFQELTFERVDLVRNGIDSKPFYTFLTKLELQVESIRE